MLITIDFLKALLDQIYYKGWKFHCDNLGPGFFVQVQFWATCNDYPGNESKVQHGRKWYISPFATKSEIVLTALKAVITAEEHEVRERFTFRKQRIFGPHLDVENLVWALEEKKIEIDKRD